MIGWKDGPVVRLRREKVLSNLVPARINRRGEKA
jgi:hypothetical protein